MAVRTPVELFVMSAVHLGQSFDIALQSEPPLNSLWCQLSIFRLWRSSDATVYIFFWRCKIGNLLAFTPTWRSVNIFVCWFFCYTFFLYWHGFFKSIYSFCMYRFISFFFVCVWMVNHVFMWRRCFYNALKIGPTRSDATAYFNNLENDLRASCPARTANIMRLNLWSINYIRPALY